MESRRCSTAVSLVSVLVLVLVVFTESAAAAATEVSDRRFRRFVGESTAGERRLGRLGGCSPTSCRAGRFLPA